MTERKAIHFFELTAAGLFRAVGYRMLGYDVSYFRISNVLARNGLFSRLGRLGFRGMSYAEMPPVEINGFFKRYVSTFSRFFDDRIRLANLEASINEHFGFGEQASLVAWRGLRQRMQMRWFEMSLLADHFGRQGMAVPTTFSLPPGGIARELVGALPAKPGTTAPGLLEHIVPIASILLRFAASAVRRAIGRLAATRDTSAASPRVPTDAGKFEVLYFPHQGISYGDLFIKDQYYSSDPESPFAATRILHLAASRLDEPSAASVLYYRGHGLAFDSIDQISPFGWRSEFFTLLSFLRLAIRARVFSGEELWRWQGYRIAAYFFAFRMLARYVAAVRAFPSARVALVGYDVLFSPWLAAALVSAGVRTVATQERFILPFYGHLDALVDHYLVWGERVQEEIEKNPVSFCRKELVVVGPPRAERIGNRSFNVPADDKYARIRNHSFLVLALDYHTTKTWDEDRLARAATWRLVRNFYEVMLNLARRYPKIHVVIKGKDLSNLKNPHLSEVIGRIERQENIEFETALDRYTPAYMATIADLGVALHTSLGDEMLAAGRPCLFYDEIGFLDDLYDYDGFPVVVRSFEELSDRVGRMLDNGPGAFMDDKDFAALRSYLYGQSGEPTRDRIQKNLEGMLAQSRLRRAQS